MVEEGLGQAAMVPHQEQTRSVELRHLQGPGSVHCSDARMFQRVKISLKFRQMTTLYLKQLFDLLSHNYLRQSSSGNIFCEQTRPDESLGTRILGMELSYSFCYSYSYSYL